MECPYCGGNNFEIDDQSNTQSSYTISESKDFENKDGKLYSSKLEMLIEHALSDSELSEKEKQILFKKAELEGIDLDEFEMILDSKLNSLKNRSILPLNNQSNNSSALNSTVKESYEQLEFIIDLGLKDGEITINERNTIISKGLNLGISQNESEMILDSKISEFKNQKDQVAAPKSNKFGEVKKCPACGSIVSSYNVKCGDCSYEFSDIEANASVQKLFQMLNEVESNRSEDKKSSDSLLGAVGNFYTNALNNSVTNKIDKQKMEIIKNFPIPTTKNDIIEFLTLAVPNAKKIGTIWNASNPEIKSHNDFVPIWKAKCEQIIMKARFSLKDDKSVLEDIMNYGREIGIK